MGEWLLLLVESPSMKRLGNSPLGVFSLLLHAVDSSFSAVAFVAFFIKDFSNVSCFCLRYIIFLKYIIALSLKMCTALFADMVSG